MPAWCGACLEMLMASVARRIIDPSSMDPSIFVRAEARRDRRITRIMRNGTLYYAATISGRLVESTNILEVYDQLPEV